MVKKLTCENGDMFGYWTVTDNVPIIKSGHTYVKVRCKCGKEEIKCLSDLKSGRTTGCRSCKARDRSRKINIGDIYKNWEVIDGPRTTEKYHNIEYLVKCTKCGESTRWIQPNELQDPNRCFMCQKCAMIKSGKEQAIKNGAIGDLNMTKYSKMKRTAEARNIPFEVTIDFLWDLYEKQKHKCAITGDIINNIEEASLDRIDSSKSYTENNVQWVTKQANLSKHVMTMNQLYEFCKKVLKHANQQPSQPLTKLEGSETNS